MFNIDPEYKVEGIREYGDYVNSAGKLQDRLLTQYIPNHLKKIAIRYGFIDFDVRSALAQDRMHGRIADHGVAFTGTCHITANV